MYESGDPDEKLRALVQKQKDAVVKAKARLREFERTMASYTHKATVSSLSGKNEEQLRGDSLKALLQRQQLALAKANARLNAIQKITKEAGLFQSLN
jgi:hypothetical protein